MSNLLATPGKQLDRLRYIGPADHQARRQRASREEDVTVWILAWWGSDVIYTDRGQATHRVSLPECLEQAPLETLKSMHHGRSQLPFSSGMVFFSLIFKSIRR